MTDQRQRCGWICLADFADQIGEVVLKLAEVADVTSGAR